MKSKGFTLIELLVVVAIIGILATVVLASLGSARTKATDAKKMSTLRAIEKGLELYYLDNGRYPTGYAYTCCGTGAYNPTFEAALAPYVTFDLDDPLFDEVATGLGFYYQTSSGDSYQTYGMAIELESSSNSSIETGDGGYYSSLWEIGQRPAYCKTKYNNNWLNGPGGAVCVGGN